MIVKAKLHEKHFVSQTMHGEKKYNLDDTEYSENK